MISLTPSGLPKMIGICGYPTHGKSTVQTFLEALGVVAKDDAFALRQEVCRIYGLTWEQVTTQEGKADIVEGIDGEMMTVRKLLGDYGQRYGETPHGPNYWIERALQDLRTEESSAPVSFASLRRSQASAVKEAGGLIIAIQDRRKPMSSHYFDEYDYDPIDTMIFNEGSIEELNWMTFQTVVEYLQPSVEQIQAAARLF